MNKRYLIKGGVVAFALLAVLYPLYVRFNNVVWAPDATLFTLFPFFGLLAFSILWLHVISGVFEPWLRKYFDFGAFVHYTSLIVLASIILHPLLLFWGLNFSITDIMLYGSPLYLRLGIAGWLLLIIYDVGKALQKYDFFVRHWSKILFISTLGIFVIFFHSLGLGADLQQDPLRSVWIFYGVTAILATIYNYGIKRTSVLH